MIYQAMPKDEVAARLLHMRELFRRIRPATDLDRIAHEKRETITKNLIDNLFRTKAHPTLRTVLDVAEIFSLTLDGAHQLFGYELDAIRKYDLELSRGRTHILETYPFYRDLKVDVPDRLNPQALSGQRPLLRDLVPVWQNGLAIRAVEGAPWKRSGAFYVHVGTQDSLGASLPPGSLALVEPISKLEEQRPDPRTIYLLQFGNGYRCSKCVVTGRKLFLLSDQRPIGRREFVYPGTVRVVGRIRMFALSLPLPEYRSLGSLPDARYGAPLLLPWEHPSRDHLFSAKHLRFHRLPEETADLQRVFQTIFASQLSERTARRYRRPSSSQPHIDTLIQMVLSSTTRYSDALRVERSLPPDVGRYSLDTLLNASSLDDVVTVPETTRSPIPADLWTTLRDAFVEWPDSLSTTYPRLESITDRVVRLSANPDIQGLSPAMTAGSLLLLDPSPHKVPSTAHSPRTSGWCRPIYALRRGAEIVCGYLQSESGHHTLVGDPEGRTWSHAVSRDQLGSLAQVTGVAVPV